MQNARISQSLDTPIDFSSYSTKERVRHYILPIAALIFSLTIVAGAAWLIQTDPQRFDERMETKFIGLIFLTILSFGYTIHQFIKHKKDKFLVYPDKIIMDAEKRTGVMLNSSSKVSFYPGFFNKHSTLKLTGPDVCAPHKDITVKEMAARDNRGLSFWAHLYETVFPGLRVTHTKDKTPDKIHFDSSGYSFKRFSFDETIRPVRRIAFLSVVLFSIFYGLTFTTAGPWRTEDYLALGAYGILLPLILITIYISGARIMFDRTLGLCKSVFTTKEETQFTWPSGLQITVPNSHIKGYLLYDRFVEFTVKPHKAILFIRVPTDLKMKKHTFQAFLSALEHSQDGTPDLGHNLYQENVPITYTDHQEQRARQLYKGYKISAWIFIPILLLVMLFSFQGFFS